MDRMSAAHPAPHTKAVAAAWMSVSMTEPVGSWAPPAAPAPSPRRASHRPLFAAAVSRRNSHRIPRNHRYTHDIVDIASSFASLPRPAPSLRIGTVLPGAALPFLASFDIKYIRIYTHPSWAMSESMMDGYTRTCRFVVFSVEKRRRIFPCIVHNAAQMCPMAHSSARHAGRR